MEILKLFENWNYERLFENESFELLELWKVFEKLELEKLLKYQKIRKEQVPIGPCAKVTMQNGRWGAFK